ncbi:MAG: heme-binding protein [Alphaproteobacteria bacterium]|nr:heme-binding protein [Alphaproteobacteria bacterium]MDE2041975.1 heme-binding protein [Alphaproteobacteria bacterium]MDE2339939.1 heme-binding protein [Alphaproteobacteria bacterium]
MAGIKASILVLVLALGAGAVRAADAPAAPDHLIAADKGVIQAPIYGMPVSLDAARKMAEAARAKATSMGVPGFSIAIVSPDGSLVLFERSDATTYVSIEFAMSKARTAAIARRATGPAPDGSMTTPAPDLIALPGGFPIIAGGRTIGGIGVSGTEGADVAIAKAALAAVK